MPAASGDIAAGTRAIVTVTWSDASVKTRYPSAKDMLTQPIDGWLDSETDAQTLVNARGALVGTERQRFSVQLDGLTWFDPTAGLPQVTLVDAEQGANVACLVPRISVDLDTERTGLELIG